LNGFYRLFTTHILNGDTLENLGGDTPTGEKRLAESLNFCCFWIYSKYWKRFLLNCISI